VLQPLKDRRTRQLQTLFGTVEVEAPRFKVCHCRLTTPMAGAALFSPVCALLTARCTPELARVQAELGAHTSFRDAARILDRLLPTSPANQESVRNRTHAVALRLEAADRQAAAGVTAVQDGLDKAAAADASRPIVMLDGAYIRAVTGHQVRNFEAICGKVEREGHPTRRFALVRSVAKQPHALLRAVLQDQGWRQADLDLTRRGHRQPAGECPHEQATADALVAPRRPSRASGQGRSAGRTVWPPGTPNRGVAPQVFDTPRAISATWLSSSTSCPSWSSGSSSEHHQPGWRYSKAFPPTRSITSFSPRTIGRPLSGLAIVSG